MLTFFYQRFPFYLPCFYFESVIPTIRPRQDSKPSLIPNSGPVHSPVASRCFPGTALMAERPPICSETAGNKGEKILLAQNKALFQNNQLNSHAEALERLVLLPVCFWHPPYPASS